MILVRLCWLLDHCLSFHLHVLSQSLSLYHSLLLMQIPFNASDVIIITCAVHFLHCGVSMELNSVLSPLLCSGITACKCCCFLPLSYSCQ